MATLFAQLVKPGIKRLVIEMFGGVQYVLTQQEYDELVAEEVVTRRFAMSWDALILPFKVTSRPPMYLMLGRSHANKLSKFTKSLSKISCGPSRKEIMVFQSE